MFRFPYGNLHGLNLDWFLDEWKKFQASFTSAFTASINTVGVNQHPDVDVTYDQNTGIYNFDFDLPEAVKPLTFQIGYTSSNNGTVIPTGVTWHDTPPYVSAGDYLWTRCLAVYNDGQNFATYSVARQGIDGQGSPATTFPLMDGTAAIGASASFARADHVHPSDTSKLNTSALATTVPAMDGTGSAGTSSNVARADHVHPRDTSKLNTSALSTTNPIMDGTASPGTSGTVARGDHVHPSDTTKLDVSALSSANPQMDGVASAGTSTDVARADHVHPADTSKQDANDEGDGYFKSADGTLIQWGVASVTTSGTAQTNYPTQNPTQPAYRGYLEVTFSTEYYNTPSVCVGGDNALYGIFDAHDITTAGFMIEGFHNSLTTISVTWIAIGRWKA